MATLPRCGAATPSVASRDVAAVEAMAGSDWRIFQLDDLLARKQGIKSPYLEFLRVPSLSCGIYTLKVGAKDLQGPHDEDEVYLVLSGRGRLRVNDSDHAVERGSVLYVRATSEHSFFEIDEDMTLLVFFASGGPSEA
jgi:mannose-6-phosphate isomerase-like protein (cupin superfamily)